MPTRYTEDFKRMEESTGRKIRKWGMVNFERNLAMAKGLFPTGENYMLKMTERFPPEEGETLKVMKQKRLHICVKN